MNQKIKDLIERKRQERAVALGQSSVNLVNVAVSRCDLYYNTKNQEPKQKRNRIKVNDSRLDLKCPSQLRTDLETYALQKKVTLAYLIRAIISKHLTKIKENNENQIR